jgi:hypothetical protein
MPSNGRSQRTRGDNDVSKSRQFDVCLRAIEQMGCGVALTQNAVRVRFPPDPNDPLAAPDGEEREYPRPYFTLMITRVFMELTEAGIIGDDGSASESFLQAVRDGLRARREGRMRPWSEIREELGILEGGTL